MMKFVLWYLKTDYFPTRLSSRIDVLWNKSTYLIMFIAAFAASGVLNGFRNKLKSKLNDPYFNSIPAYSGIAEIDEDSMFAKYPDMRFDPYEFLGFNKALRHFTRDTVYLRGISMDSNHPYFSMIDKHIVQRFGGGNLKNFKSEGVIISKNTFRKLFDLGSGADSTLNYPDTLSINLLEAHIYPLGNRLTPVYAICDQLPLDMDFVLYEDFMKRQGEKKETPTDPQLAEESKNYWKFIVDDDNIDFKILKQHGLAIREFLKKSGRNDISTFPVDSETPPGAIEVGFGLNKISMSAIRKIVDSMNLFLLNSDKYTGDSIRILTENKTTVSNNSSSDAVILKDWEYFTVTPDVADKKHIYNFKNDFENNFRGARLEMKSIDNVFFLDEVNSIVKILEYLFLTAILLSSIIINYKTLTIHLYRKKNHIAYIKNLGVSLGVFKLVYVCEAFIETLLAVIAALLVSQFLNAYFDTGIFEFLFFSPEILVFIFFTLILTMFSYQFAINKLLSRPFRDIIENN